MRKTPPFWFRDEWTDPASEEGDPSQVSGREASGPMKLEPSSYPRLLEHLSTIIEEGKHYAVRQINTALVITYWQLGKWIIIYEQKGKERAEYGEQLLKKLAQDLIPKYGKGFSERNLELMRKFYLCYPTSINHPISQTLSAKFERLEIPALKHPFSWSHYVLLMGIEDEHKRRFYENLTFQGHWSVRQLDREVNALLYERTALSKRKELVLAKADENPIVLKPEDEVKDSYVLDFLGLKNEYSESDLEDALIRHLENFLLELGRGFTFVARQKRFVLDGDEYRIDLLLFNISLKAYIILEIKLTKFTHAHAGQTNFYVNWVKDNVLPCAENDPFGIILCSDKNNTTVKYATGGLSNKIFVSKYLLELPKPEELQRELERGKELFLQRQVGRPPGKRIEDKRQKSQGSLK